MIYADFESIPEPENIGKQNSGNFCIKNLKNMLLAVFLIKKLKIY